MWLTALAVFWLGGVVSGLWVLWAYENRPGAAANAPQGWPVATALTRAASRPTLVFVAHPQCTCTRARRESSSTLSLLKTGTKPAVPPVVETAKVGLPG